MPLEFSPFTYEISPYERQRRLRIGAFQLVVDVSLTLRNCLSLSENAPRFPAVIDTGHGHNFSIRESHLLDLAGLDLSTLPVERPVQVTDSHGKTVLVDCYAAALWVHAGKDQAPPIRLALDGGFSCYRSNGPVAGPPFPLIGARALSTGAVFLGVDYERLLFFIETPDSRLRDLAGKPR